MNADQPEQTQDEPAEIRYDFKSVGEAAKYLKLSESTVWRYSAQNILPSYRIGRKRVMFRTEDLNALLKRVRRKEEPAMAVNKDLRLMAMAEGGDADARMAMERATALREGILARRAGIALESSWADIDDAREERSRDL